MRISDWSSDVCSSDLGCAVARDRVADPFALCDVRARLEIEAGAREPDAVFASKGLFGIEECLQRSEIERRERTVPGIVGRDDAADEAILRIWPGSEFRIHGHVARVGDVPRIGRASGRERVCQYV